MPKAEAGSIKDIGKRIKAKGLQKLKFYCQMCQKQCRDANGFKCHLTSDSHLRQMKIFSDNATGYLDRYSKEFEKMFLDTLRMRHSTTKINANNVYQEVIRDKHHIHMNSTVWASLSDFCKYLGKMGKCIVEETERGWYISYIERDISKLAHQAATEQRLQNEQIAEQQYHQQLEIQRIEATKQLIEKTGTTLYVEPTNISENLDDDDRATIQLSLDTKVFGNTNNKVKKQSSASVPLKSVFGDDDDEGDDNDTNLKNNSDIERHNDKKKSDSSDETTRYPQHKSESEDGPVTDNNKKKYDRKRKYETDVNDGSLLSSSIKKSNNNPPKNESSNSSSLPPWLYHDIIVRIVTKSLADGKYFKQKAVVDKIHDDGYTADVTLINDDDYNDRDGSNNKKSPQRITIRIDQDDLQTVAPKHIGETVRIIRHSKYCFKKAIVTELHKKQYQATLQLKNDPSIILTNIDFDDFTKIV